ncbi:unnamed protein product [Caenorhabditis angaria]|uniref:Uncharacterized protein n=1 Tax=Caenorhabditis angaria TaxID=860376 RepID=A0A9P1IWJ7_9PELO|nr:unnamed protein product [Caenorhabditis angaria]
MPDERPQYFANGDFDRVANDIISSPRRGKPENFDFLFKINEKQQEYYTKCFKHLIKTTQGGKIDMNGALCGADERIVAFFKRSSLDVGSLSKIWSLADVNEDGWLELAEFSIAMHLVVLKVKGEVPIPDVLPDFCRPAMTPQRGSEPPFVHSSWAPSPSPLPDKPIIKQFSDTPPLLVDSRPTAIKHSALMALKSPSGPPPAPPHRPQSKGHGRSASLDLKMIAFNNGIRPFPPSSLALWSTTANSEVAEDQEISSNIATTSTNFASFPGTPDSLLTVPPPIPQRTSPSPLLKKSPVSGISVGTQTELKIYDEEEVRQFITGMDGKMEHLIGEELEAQEGKGVERWSKRCEALRQQNAELELERARLAQVRIQLEIRIQEFQDRLKMSSV